MTPPALVRSASQPNPLDSYLYSPFKTAATSALPHSERKPPRPAGGSVWSESFRDHDGSREAERDGFAREPAPVWLSRNDSASSSSSYGGSSRPLSYGSVGEGHGRDDESHGNPHVMRQASQAAARPMSGRRAMPVVPSTSLAPPQSNPSSIASHVPSTSQAYESEHDRRPIHSLRSPAATTTAAAAAAANGAATSASNEQVFPQTNRHRHTKCPAPSRISDSLSQRAWSASAALTGSSSTDPGDRGGTGGVRCAEPSHRCVQACPQRIFSFYVLL
jgi:hypothetical protein